MKAFLAALVLVLPLSDPALRADEVDDAIAGLDKAIKEKSKADIKHFVALVGDKFSAAKPEQQKDIIRLAGVALNNPEQEVKDAAVEAVAKTDARGVPLLIKEIDKKTTEDNGAYHAACIKAIGRLKDPKAGLDRLLKLLKNKSIDVVATSAEALASYKDAPIETKKTIAEDLLKIYGSIASAANNPRDSTAQSKLNRLRPSADETLRNLTGQKLEGYPNWLKWWNDSGKKAAKW
jgi:hypothetical protein